MPGHQQPYSNEPQQNQNRQDREREAPVPKPHQGQNNMERGAKSDDEHESLLDLEPTTTPGRDHADANPGAIRDRERKNRIGQRHDDDKSRTNQSSQGQPTDDSQTQRQGGQPPR